MVFGLMISHKIRTSKVGSEKTGEPASVSIGGDIGHLTRLRRLISASCSSGQRFAFGFLQIRSRPRHPCRSANSSPYRASRGLAPPSECALPGAPTEKRTSHGCPSCCVQSERALLRHRSHQAEGSRVSLKLFPTVGVSRLHWCHGAARCKVAWRRMGTCSKRWLDARLLACKACRRYRCRCNLYYFIILAAVELEHADHLGKLACLVLQRSCCRRRFFH